jgi:hypothetical protein
MRGLSSSSKPAHPSSVPELAVLLLDVFGGERRAVARVLDRLQVGRLVCPIAFEFDHDEFPFRVEGEDVEPVRGVLEALKLRGNDEEVFSEDSWLVGDPLFDVLPFEHAE